MFNFYQINRDDEIRTRDYLVIKALIHYQVYMLFELFMHRNGHEML